MEQTRYMVTDGKGHFAVSNTGTIHLSEINNWTDVKVFKEYNTAKKCIEKNAVVLGSCHVVKMRITYSEVEKD